MSNEMLSWCFLFLDCCLSQKDTQLLFNTCVCQCLVKCRQMPKENVTFIEWCFWSCSLEILTTWNLINGCVANLTVLLQRFDSSWITHSVCVLIKILILLVVLTWIYHQYNEVSKLPWKVIGAVVQQSNDPLLLFSHSWQWNIRCHRASGTLKRG